MAQIVKLWFGLSGESFHQAALRDISEWESVTFVRDPGNQYDPNAIAVHGSHGERIGWVPKKGNLISKHEEQVSALDQPTLAKLLDAGASITAQVCHIRDDDPDDDIAPGVWVEGEITVRDEFIRPPAPESALAKASEPDAQAASPAIPTKWKEEERKGSFGPLAWIGLLIIGALGIAYILSKTR